MFAVLLGIYLEKNSQMQGILVHCGLLQKAKEEF